ncbi:pectinesterase inhibitor 10-like [Solanum stenotomum]|uniref:pectinesterase inhibitor 10-like n=1 Tax=Solanum stenotomum TaxID=172797 RepID=UPI0020D18D58|nr:pectinesterase inhibitor 10-like [Solanum stenotomum]
MKMIQAQGKVSTLLLLIIIYVGGSNSQFATWPGPAVPRPLCLSQFSLVNNACQFLPLTPLPPPGPAPALRPVPTFSPAPGPAPAPGLVPTFSPAPAPPTSLGYTQTPAEEECCRWMKAVDSECVCSLLTHLPTFLARPIHQYTTLAHATCSVTFTCGSSARYQENDHQKSPHSP